VIDGRETRYRGWARVKGEHGVWKRTYGKWRLTAREAFADAQRIRGHVERGGGSMTLANAMAAVTEEAKAKRTEGTVRWYKEHFAVLLDKLGADRWLCDITPASLEEFVRDRVKDVKPATVNADLTALHRVFAVAIRRGHATTNPVRMVDRPRADRPAMHFFPAEDLGALLDQVGDQFARDLFIAFASTGLRRAELARLLVADVDAAAGVLWVRGKVRAQSHPLPPAAAAAAARLALLAGGEALISGTTERARRERIAETFRTWQRKLKEPRFHPHALRHSVATIMLRQGAAPGTVQRFLRHASYAMTQRYVHMVEADVRGATARLRIVGGEDEAAKHG
jgi:site-specific recombinase XerD